MLTSISDLIGVKREIFDKTGAFNAILGVDSELFVDPALLFKTEIPEFKEAKNKINSYFNKVLFLLRHSKTKNDKFWRESVKLLTLPEVKGLSIGYSTESSDGNGIGKKLAQKIIEDASFIIKESENDVYFFELLGLFEKGVGADRISDMMIHILHEEFQEYSKRICIELGVNYEEQCVTEDGVAIIILPKSLLTNLPHSDRIFKSEVLDEEIRDILNISIGKSWKNAFTKDESSEVDKQKILECFAENPIVFETFITEYLNKAANNYNFQTDPNGEFSWYHDVKQLFEGQDNHYVTQTEKINDKKIPLIKKVEEMCAIFKDLVENNGLDSLFYKNQTPEVREAKNEKAIQLVFYGVCHFFCLNNNIDLTPEGNTGKGPVDFKCSIGNEKVIIEVKKTLHSRIDHGYFVQLEEYKKSEKVNDAIFMLVILDGETSAKNLGKFQRKIAEAPKEKLTSKIIYIDAAKKKSASKK